MYWYKVNREQIVERNNSNWELDDLIAELIETKKSNLNQCWKRKVLKFSIIAHVTWEDIRGKKHKQYLFLAIVLKLDQSCPSNASYISITFWKVFLKYCTGQF